MLKLGLTLAKRHTVRIWEATKNFLTSTGDVFHDSDGKIFNVI
jgi:hypothetical protein|tara:strand:+ start:449 stop:577 length:129 start_codon:yes stop_codon:yes gene_type:complete